jgi:hypothetical protein
MLPILSLLFGGASPAVAEAPAVAIGSITVTIEEMATVAVTIEELASATVTIDSE